MTNILISSVSAKVQLVELFRDALKDCGGGRIIGTDADKDACAAAFVDAFERVPPDGAAGFDDLFVDLCARHKIQLVIPTRDSELPMLARLKPRLDAMGVALPVPDLDILETCLNKRAFHEYCEIHGFPVLPRREPKTESDFPVFVRLYSGSGGRSAFLVPDMEIWRQMRFKSKDYICQPLVKDEEFSVDLLLDFDSNPLQAVARSRQRVIFGESWRSQIIHMPEMEALALELASKLGLKGHNLMQAFRSKENGINVIEINPRFGGCSNLSITGGLDSPKRLIQMVQGDMAGARAPRQIRYGLQSNRHGRDIYRQLGE